MLALSISVTSFLIIAVLCWFKRRRNKGRRGQPKLLHDIASGSRSREDLSNEKNVDEQRGKADLPVFDLSTIVEATKEFSSANMLGHGGFVIVYKGNLPDGQEIAVKRLSRNSGQGVEEFKNEVRLIAELQHRNLVRLFGCCIDRKERMLIYEYMRNRSLDLFIFDKNKRSLLDWRKRFQIIIGIARGVLYLHQDSRLKIIHRDLKASNVLLDSSLNPKISDFGMARMFGDDQIEANTNRVVGTYGYMSPEYAMDGLYSTKSDVFSFGVLALEIICGKKNNFQFEDSSLNLVGQAKLVYLELVFNVGLFALLWSVSPFGGVLPLDQVFWLCTNKSPSPQSERVLGWGVILEMPRIGFTRVQEAWCRVAKSPRESREMTGVMFQKPVGKKKSLMLLWRVSLRLVGDCGYVARQFALDWGLSRSGQSVHA
ncbi:hypothetical protein ACLB2K_027824 [Fragaria x ananassa]